MKLLFDTQAFIWWDSDPSHLSTRALALCQDARNTLYLSVASAWEMQIKSQLGKLTLRIPLPEIVGAQHKANAVKILPVTLRHVYALAAMPAPHRDPFDRLLAAQANVEGALLITADRIFDAYPVQTAW